MSDAESYRRIAHRLNDLDARLRMLETHGHRVQSIAPYFSLGAARAIWSMGSVDIANPIAADISGNGYDLDAINTPVFGTEGASPYVWFNGTTQYLRKVDGGAGAWADILGTEPYVTAAERGLTLGGWFKPYRLTNNEFLMGKSTGVAATSAYSLVFQGAVANDPVLFSISTGAAFVSATVQPGISASSWVFVAGRYDPSTEIKVYVGIGDAEPIQTATTVAGIPATLPDVAADFTIGSYSGGASYFSGRASRCFLCASMLSDEMIHLIYSQTRALYGV